ncbi:MAG: DUF2207 domain-containing protein [Sphaerochaeta sp.]|jgi:uncharacterized membrane protein YgcG
MKRQLVIILLLATVLSTLGAQDYHFERFEMAVDVSLDNSYAIEERITANFSTPRHGIYREIPIQFGNVRTKVEDLKSSDPITRDSSSSSWVTFRLGSADRTVQGIKEYVLSYRYSIGDDRNKEYDELYFNLLGDGWQAPIAEFLFSVTFPKPIDPSMVFVTGGRRGSTTERATFVISEDRMRIVGRAVNLVPGEAITLRVQMEEGYFSEVIPFVDWTAAATIASVVAVILMLVHGFVLFGRYGREEVFVPVVRYEAPTDLSPLEVGYLADGVVDNKDLTSMIFHWADGGYLSIKEEGRKEFTFTKIRDLSAANAHEKKLFNDLFASGDGTTVNLKQLQKGTYGESMAKVKTLVQKYFKGPRSLNDQTAERKRVFSLLYGPASVIILALSATLNTFDGEILFFIMIGFFSFGISLLAAHRLSAMWLIGSKTKRIFKYVALGFAALMLFLFALVILKELLYHGPLYSLVVAALLVGAPSLFGMLTIFTAKRSAYAQQQLEQIAGYMEFIKAVEVPRLKLMVEKDPQLFYHVLGYAIVLGLEGVWAKKFRTIAIEEATWYSGPRPIRTALFYSALSNRLHSSVIERSLYTQSKGGARSPVRSSFGSSGFSGGGFGGGGGGAW